LARLGGAHPLVAIKHVKTVGKILHLLARVGINDADAVERDVQLLGGLLHFRLVAEDDGRAEPQGMKLPGRLQNARLFAFGKNHPFRMPLQFFDDAADKTHDDKLAASDEIAKSFCHGKPILLIHRSCPRHRIPSYSRTRTRTTTRTNKAESLA